MIRCREIWPLVPLASAFSFQEGPGIRKWQFQNTGVKVLNVSNIDKSGCLLLKKSERYIREAEAYGKYRHFLIDAGDLVIASSGISFDADGLLRTRGVFVEENHLPLCMNTSTIRFKATNGKSDLRYLRHWLDSVDFRLQISRLVTGSAQLNFGPSHLRAIRISLPPLDEQRRIAAILDEADALRAKRRAALAHLDQLRQSIFMQLFGSAFSDNVVLGDCVEEFRYGTSEKSANKGIPTLRIPNVIGGQVNLENLKTVPVSNVEFGRLSLMTNDVLFVRTNGNPDYVGRCATVHDDLGKDIGLLPHDFIYASYLIRARLRSAILNADFLCTFLSMEAGRKQIRERAKTSAGQFNINTEGLGSIRIPRVPHAAQLKFATATRELNLVTGHYLRHEAELDTLFASLQHRAFRGEL